MTSDTPNTQEGGFILVEVLVSLLIFSLISVGTIIALTATLDARDRAQTKMAQAERLAAAHRLLTEDFATLTQRTNRDGLGSVIDESRQVIEPDQLVLTRRARPNPDGLFTRGDLLRVSWRVEDGNLIRAFLPHENPATIEPPLDRIVLQEVSEMRIDPVFPEGTVRGLTPLASVLSAPAVSIELTFADGSTTRHLFTVPDV
ncbi:MAG: type II secretion system protein GspJ [Pseudomonadota bacterium]